jgi:hypothetical protein
MSARGVNNNTYHLVMILFGSSSVGVFQHVREFPLSFVGPDRSSTDELLPPAACSLRTWCVLDAISRSAPNGEVDVGCIWPAQRAENA